MLTVKRMLLSDILRLRMLTYAADVCPRMLTVKRMLLSDIPRLRMLTYAADVC
jgi:hypothetical protein